MAVSHNVVNGFKVSSGIGKKPMLYSIFALT
jgi:hypothetical protein